MITRSPIAARKTETSIVSHLRELLPRRPLSFDEAERLAELQASTLLEAHGLRGGPVREELIASLPRIDVQYRSGLPGSGMTTWERGAWRIGINADEPTVRQRFTLAHELKHVLDASHEDAIYAHLPPGPARRRHVEAVCDHFAASLLMPRAWVKRLWGEGLQDLAVLARQFDVSQAAMLIRLQYLGLVEPQPRCVPALGRIAVSGGGQTRHGKKHRTFGRARQPGHLAYERSDRRVLQPVVLPGVGR